MLTALIVLAIAIGLLAAVIVLLVALVRGKGERRIEKALRAHLAPLNIAYMALFTALAFAASFLEFAVFPAAPYLKLDFANVFFMIEGFIFGPVEAVVSIAVKELLCLTKTSTGGVGEIANFLMSTAYVVLPAIFYRFKKGRRWVALFMACACLLQIAVSLPVNRFINFPFFMGSAAGAIFADAWVWVLAFNAVKSVAVSLAVFLIYKPLSRLIRMTADKVAKRRKRAGAS